jgi:hypothetical protein
VIANNLLLVKTVNVVIESFALCSYITSRRGIACNYVSPNLAELSENLLLCYANSHGSRAKKKHAELAAHTLMIPHQALDVKLK